ncbi:MAG: hypothetical protein AAB074_13360 [Planctomycetota bacterium]
MLKGLPIGLVIGALLAFVLFRAVEARRDDASASASKSASATAAGPANAEAEALKGELAKLDAERASLEEELKGLDGRIAAAKKDKGSPKPVDAKKFTNPWSPMAKKLFLLKDKLDEIQNENSEEYRDLMLQFMEIAKELMEESGFNLNEFEMSPYGSPMLMLAVLEGAEPPLDPEALLRAQAEVAKAEETWKALSARKDELSTLEWRRNGAALVWDAMAGIRGQLTPEQVDWFKTGRMWSDGAARVDTWPLTGKRDQVEGQLLEELKRTLNIQEGGDAPLRPLVSDFLRQYDSMEADWDAKAAAGQPLSDVQKALARADLAIGVEKRIKESVNLTEDQQKALKSLGHAWEITITD